MISKNKIASFQGYNPKNRRLAFANFSENLGCYLVTLIDGIFGDTKKHEVKIAQSLQTAREIMESWLQGDAK